jgi:hypothetical protein
MKLKVAGGELKRHILSLITARGWRRRDAGFVTQASRCTHAQEFRSQVFLSMSI